MKNSVKIGLVILNLIVLVLSLLWIIKPDYNWEPITVLITQSLSLITLLFENQISNILVKKIKDKGDVKIDIHKKDKTNMHVEDVSGDAKVSIKKK
jgi:hypothetical protein